MRWAYYLCGRVKRQAGCDGKRVSKARLEEAVLVDLYRKVLSTENLVAMYQAYKESYESLLAKLQPKRESLGKELAEVRRQLTNVVNAIANLRHNQALVDKLTELLILENSLIQNNEAPGFCYHPLHHPVRCLPLRKSRAGYAVYRISGVVDKESGYAIEENAHY